MVYAMTNTMMKVKLGDLVAHEHNIRFDDTEDIGGLAASIASVGIVTALTVKDVDGQLVVVAGHRRLAALRSLDWTDEIPVMVVNGETPDTARMLVENMQRVDLNPVEQAFGFETLLTDGDKKRSQKDVAKLVGVDPSMVSRRLSLITLPARILTEVRADASKAQLAEAFVPLVKLGMDPDEMVEFFYSNPGEWDIGRAIDTLKEQAATAKVVALYEKAGLKAISQLDEELAPDRNDNLGDGPMDAAAAAERFASDDEDGLRQVVYVYSRMSYKGEMSTAVYPCYLAEEQTKEGISDAEKKQRQLERLEKQARTEQIELVMAGKIPAEVDDLFVEFGLSRAGAEGVKRLCKLLNIEVDEAVGHAQGVRYKSAEEQALWKMYSEGSVAVKRKVKALVLMAADNMPNRPSSWSTPLFQQED